MKDPEGYHSKYIKTNNNKKGKPEMNIKAIVTTAVVAVVAVAIAKRVPVVKNYI